MRRAVKIILVAVAALILAPIVAVALAVLTETGTKFVAERAAGYLPEGMRYGRVEGRLAEGLRILDIEVETEGALIRLDSVEWRWRLGALRGGRLVIERVEAEGLTIVTLAAEEAEPVQPDEPFELPERLDLPVSIVLEALALRDIALMTSPDAEPVRVDSVELSGRFAGSRLDLERIEIRSPLLDLSADAAMTLAEAYPASAELAWTLRLPDYPPVEGATRLAGTLAELGIEQELGPPYNVRAEATVLDLVAVAEGLRLEARAEIDDLELTAVREGLTPLSLSAALQARGTLEGLELEGTLTAEGLEQGTLDAMLSLQIAPHEIQVRQLLLTQPSHDGRLEAEGRIGLEEGVAADLRIVWERLQWPLNEAPVVASPRGEAHFTGPLENYRLSLAADFEAPEQPPLALELSGEGSLESIAVELYAFTPSGSVRGTVDAAWAPEIQAHVELAAEDMDVGLLAADWPGRVSLELAAEGRLEGDLIDVRVQRLSASGEVREQRLAVEARELVYRGDPNARAEHAVDIEAANLALGGTMLDVSGRIADTADLRWHLQAEDLSALLAGASGRVSGTGTVTGTLPMPRVEARLAGEGLVYDEYRLGRVDIDAQVDPAGEASSVLSVDARDGLVAGVELADMVLRGSGTPADHRLELELSTSEGDAQLALTGRLSEPLDSGSIWSFRLLEARLAHPELAPWSLQAPAEGHAGAEEATVARHCWSSGDARLCLAGGWSTAGAELDFELDQLALAYLAPLLPPGYDVDAEVSAAGWLRQDGGGVLTAELDLATGAGEIVVTVETPGTPGGAPSVERLRLEPSHARLAFSPEEVLADVALNLEHGHLRLDGRLAETTESQTDAPLTARQLSGVLAIDVPDLSFVSDFSPDFEEMRGAIAGTLDFGGTLEAPVLTGRIALRDGVTRVAAAGITVEDIAVLIEGRGGDSIALSASAVSGGGSVSMDGELALLADAPAARLSIRGRDFLIADTRDARLYASPDLQIVADDRRIDVRGEVRVPRAELTPGTSSSRAAVSASADQVLLSAEEEEGAEREPVRDLYAEVRIVLGDAVNFDGYGLTARFTGNVVAVQTPGAPVTATGQINVVDGEYRAYGQGLVIESGTVYFAGGPLTEPALDIRAVRRPQPGIMVGAHVVGTLEEPRFTLFSEPSMSQQEQLSYLVLGRSLQEAPSGESNALSQAALSMGLRGGDFLARNIGERIGVDNFGIETGSGEAGAASDVSQAALVAGKYLSPRLYVSYGIGLFDTVNVLRMQYTIADRWRIVTQSSSESSGADVIYTIERGR